MYLVRRQRLDRGRKAGRDELVMYGLIVVKGLARTVVWKNWSGPACGGRVDALWRKRLGLGFGKLSMMSWGCVDPLQQSGLRA